MNRRRPFLRHAVGGVVFVGFWGGWLWCGLRWWGFACKLSPCRRLVRGSLRGCPGSVVWWWFENSRACLYCLFLQVFWMPVPCPVCVRDARVWGVAVWMPPFGVASRLFSYFFGVVFGFPRMAFFRFFCGGFDSGSGRTLAACLTHASRTGSRVSARVRVANG